MYWSPSTVTVILEVEDTAPPAVAEKRPAADAHGPRTSGEFPHVADHAQGPLIAAGRHASRQRAASRRSSSMAAMLCPATRASRWGSTAAKPPAVGAKPGRPACGVAQINR